MSRKCPECKRAIVNRMNDICLYCKAPLPVEWRLSEDEKSKTRQKLRELAQSKTSGESSYVSVSDLLDDDDSDATALTDRFPFLRRFSPKHNELSIYFISLTAILLCWRDESIRRFIYNITGGGSEIWPALIVFGVFIIGVFLSLLNILSRRKPTRIEVQLMLIYAVLTYAVVSICASVHLIVQGESPKTVYNWLLLAFPLWNIVLAWLGVRLFRIPYESGTYEEHFSYELATLNQVLLGSAVLLITFWVCHSLLLYHWSVNFCICIAMSSFVQCKVSHELKMDHASGKKRYTP